MISKVFDSIGSMENIKPINPDKALHYSVATWFVLAMIGQQVFAAYVMIRYGLPLIDGQYENINLSTNIDGYVEGDLSGNVMLYFHLIPAALLSFCGMLQLLPKVRERYPALHRFNGRLFLVLGMTGALTGLYLTWLRGSRLSDVGSIGITINGVLILVAGYFAWSTAIAKKFAQHKRWAVHTFFLVNGVWTFRLYLMGWYVVNQGAFGNTNKIDGPADIAISFACYLLPMCVAELVFWAQRQRSNKRKWAVVGLMVLGCLITGIGVFANILLGWIPRMVVSVSAFMQ